MKKLLVLSALTLMVSATTARAASFNFETTPLGSYSSLAMTDDGLTITITLNLGSTMNVLGTGVGQPPSFGARDLLASTFVVGEEYNANFSSGISYFQIDFGDFGQDNDTPVQVRAFSGLNGTGAQLDVHSLNWVAAETFPAFKTLIVQSATPILSVLFSSSGPFPNSIFWDNIVTRGEQAAPVPEPLTLAMIGSGLLGAAAIRRRIR